MINISLRCLPAYLELSLTWSHSHGKLLRYLFIVILFQMCASGPDAAGAAVFCIGFFNFLTAIKLQSHVGSLWQVSLFWGGELPTGNIYVLCVHSNNWKMLPFKLKDKNKQTKKPLCVSCIQAWIIYYLFTHFTHLWFDYNGLTSCVPFSWCFPDLFSLKSFEDPTAYLTESISDWTQCQALVYSWS